MGKPDPGGGAGRFSGAYTCRVIGVTALCAGSARHKLVFNVFDNVFCSGRNGLCASMQGVVRV